MCTDVDRNDKSRICVPGSVQVIGRRQIELYSRLIHTVDHVEGRLRPGFDAIDAFLTHTWAVTVTGAPKAAAMMFLERHERSARAWYGGAIGEVGFDGTLNTGLTLRTIRVKDGRAEVRVGATLLWDSDPGRGGGRDGAEGVGVPRRRAHGRRLLRRPAASSAGTGHVAAGPAGRPPRLIRAHPGQLPAPGRGGRDHGQGRLRPGQLDRSDLDLVVLSPGPGRPEDFAMSATIAAASPPACRVRGVPRPAGHGRALRRRAGHARPYRCTASRRGIMVGDGGRAVRRAARAVPGWAGTTRCSPTPPTCRRCWRSPPSATTGVVMAVEHRRCPWPAVQFHPESIMSLDDGVGLRLVANVVELLAGRGAQR